MLLKCICVILIAHHNGKQYKAVISRFKIYILHRPWLDYLPPMKVGYQEYEGCKAIGIVSQFKVYMK